MPTHQPSSTGALLVCYFLRPYLTDEGDPGQDAQKSADAIETDNGIKHQMSVRVEKFGQRQQQHEKEMIELRAQAGQRTISCAAPRRDPLWP